MTTKFSSQKERERERKREKERKRKEKRRMNGRFIIISFFNKAEKDGKKKKKLNEVEEYVN